MLTATRREQIVDLYRRGEKIESIADLYGITSSHVSKLARRKRLWRRGPVVRSRPWFRNEQGGRVSTAASPHS